MRPTLTPTPSKLPTEPATSPTAYASSQNLVEGLELNPNLKGNHCSECMT